MTFSSHRDSVSRTHILSHERSHKLNIYTEWVWSVGPRHLLMGVAADRGYYYRGALRGGRELSGTLSTFPSFLRLSLRLPVRLSTESEIEWEEEVRGEAVCFSSSLRYRGQRRPWRRAQSWNAFPSVWRWADKKRAVSEMNDKRHFIFKNVLEQNFIILKSVI